MNTYITIKEVHADNDYSTSLALPTFGISTHFIYRGGVTLEYYCFLDGKLLFSGNDFKPAPNHSIDGLDSHIELLGFLTVKPGDTDDDYFKNYTPAQLEWASSSYADDLNSMIYAYDDKDKETIDYFTSNYKK